MIIIQIKLAELNGKIEFSYDAIGVGKPSDMEVEASLTIANAVKALQPDTPVDNEIFSRTL